MNPYQQLDERAFWAPAVGRRDRLGLEELWHPKFTIRKPTRIATFGSCFAQHIGRALRDRGYNWLQTEQAPEGMSDENAKKFNYGVFSSRTGNIYTVTLLRQWTHWALGIEEAPDEVWEKDGRFYDPFRPNIEPDGFASRDEVLATREMTIQSFRAAIERSNLFVFTLGLTESWFNDEFGYEYPTCPGTIAGTFDPEKHVFRNQTFSEINTTLRQTIHTMWNAYEKMAVLLTVSSVPLTATMSGNHVLTATIESKSVLRAVAGQMSREMRRVDYFPSYEIISSAPFGGVFYEENKRSVRQDGVNHVMQHFFEGVDRKAGSADAANADGTADKKPDQTKSQAAPPKTPNGKAEDDDVVCEEEFLAAFAPEHRNEQSTGG